MINKSVAKIVVGLPVEGPFDYLVPERLRISIRVGQRVIVPFGKRTITGFVTGLDSQSLLSELKEIIALIDDQPLLLPYHLALSAWMSGYYGCTQGEAIETMVPFVLRKKKGLSFIQNQAKEYSGEAEKWLYLSQDEVAAFHAIKEKINAALGNGQGVLLLASNRTLLTKIHEQFSHGVEEGLVCLNTEAAKSQVEEWVKLRNGMTRYAIGLRSAVFAPVQDLGLVVMFGEQYYGYQEDQTPFYHARDVLLKRAAIEKFCVIFSSAAPSVELWSMFTDHPERIMHFKKKNLSRLRPIDLTNYKPRRESYLSFPLADSISKELDKGGKVLIIYNRRGFHTCTKCGHCGHVLACPRCNTPYTFMAESKKMICPSCNYMIDPENKCPECGKQQLRSFGEGIERIESSLARFFPQASLATFDKETRAVPRKANLIVATQAVLRVMEKISFSMVAVLDVDSALNRFDFRAHQKLFSLLTDLILKGTGEVIVQTRNPLQHTFQCVIKNDLKSFYDLELSSRKDLNLPPAGHLVAIVFRGKKEIAVTEAVDSVYEYFLEHPLKSIEVLSPQPDFQPKLRDQYRLMMMIKTKDVEKAVSYVRAALGQVKRRRGVIATIQVDP
ncbi:MAG: primosomal protein N' [Candidatus Omnitrophota bacterium]